MTAIWLSSSSATVTVNESALSAAVADSDDRAAQSMLGEILRALVAETVATLRPEALAKDLALSDPFPRKLFSDALALFQDASMLELGKIRVPVYLQQYQYDAVYQPTQSWSYARTDFFPDQGHSAELHKDPEPTRAALVAWLKQFVK